jgi:hypothetical protein
VTTPEDAIVRHGHRAILIARHAGTVDRFARGIATKQWLLSRLHVIVSAYLIPCGAWLARGTLPSWVAADRRSPIRVRAPVGLRWPTERRASVGQPSIYQELLTVWRPTACRISTSTLGQAGQLTARLMVMTA